MTTPSWNSRASQVGYYARIPLSGPNGAGKYALVDAQDEARVRDRTWHLGSGGYPTTNLPRKGKPARQIRLHRFVLRAKPGRHTDHINHDKLDNRRANLRRCTLGENSLNRKPLPGRDDLKGVSPNGSGFMAKLQYRGRQIYLGTFRTTTEARNAYIKGACKYFGRFAHERRYVLAS